MDNQKGARGIGVMLGVCLVITMMFPTGCTTMKKEECLNADWYQIGFEDGARGYDISRITKHRKACAKVDVIPDFDQYKKGRDQGLIEYCTAYNGYHLGLKGREYNDVCHGNLKPGFFDAYQIGREIYLFERKVAAEQGELDRLNTRMTELEDRIKVKEDELSNGCSDPRVCKVILDQIRELDNEKVELAIEIETARTRVSYMQQVLADKKNKYQF